MNKIVGYRSEKVIMNSKDGLKLVGMWTIPSGVPRECVLLIHGITTDKDEGGFYVNLASKLGQENIASLRFDWRGHGESEGKYEEVTLLGIANDIENALDTISARYKGIRIHIVAASFSGGVAVYYLAHNPGRARSLVLLNPRLRYCEKMLEDTPFWQGNGLNKAGAERLEIQGWLPYGEGPFRIGRAMINELFWVKPYQIMKDIPCPTLTIHGTKDSVVPFVDSEQYYQANTQSELIAIEGADHGFTLPGDDEMRSPETIVFRDRAIQAVAEWIKKHSQQI